jgi:hypothetical protein
MTDIKDPAFLFYSAQFMQMVSDLTMEERGMFITMLCAQHQHGELKEKTIRLLVGKPSDDVMDKFSLTENGTMVNAWLSELMDKRKFYTDSRRQNGQKGGRRAKNLVNNEEINQKETISFPYAEPTDNLPVNVNVNVNKDTNIKGVQGEKIETPKLIPNPMPHHTEVHDPATGQFVKTKTKEVAKLVPSPMSYGTKVPEELNIMLMQLKWGIEDMELCYQTWVAKCEADENLLPMNAQQAKASFKKFAWYFKANHPEIGKPKYTNGSHTKVKPAATVYH